MFACLLVVFRALSANLLIFNGENFARESCASVSVNVGVLICSDYGFELNATNHCVAASWFNASVPVVTCEFGQSYRNSSGSVTTLM